MWCKSLVYYYFIISPFAADSQDLSQQAFQEDSVEIYLKPLCQLCTIPLYPIRSWRETNGMTQKS